MAFATILTAFSAAASAASGVASLVGGMQQASAAEANAGYMAKVSRNRALIGEYNAGQAEADARTADRNAKEIGLAGQLTAMQGDLDARSEIGGVIADQSASGLVAGGPLVDTLRRLAGRDRVATRVQYGNEVTAERGRAQGFRQEAADLRTGAANARADAKVAKQNGRVEAASARMGGIAGLIQGAGSTASILLDGSQSPTVRNDFNNFWKRVRK